MVDEDKLEPCIKETIHKRSIYCYYDTPDGEDIPKKVGATVRVATLFGAVMGSQDVLMFSHARGLTNILKRYAFWMVPPAVMATVFTVVTNGLVIYREKNDVYNYFVGGALCGPILAGWARSPICMLPAAIVCGALGAAKKYANDCGTPLLFVQPMFNKGFLPVYRSDFSLTPDPKDLLKSQLEDDEC